MKSYEIDVLGFHPDTEHDEFAVIRNMAQEVAESLIKKAKLERELKVPPKNTPPFWPKWACTTVKRAKEK